MSNETCLGRLAALGLISTLALPAQAQSDGRSTSADTEKLETVVVTAQRKEESAQKVGVAVTPLSGDELAARGVTSINQLGNETPSLEVRSRYGNGTPNFRIRGIGFEDYVDNISSSVGVYVDEVAQPIVSQTQGALFDLERVEVLRGPQGTLYGRNTTGGAINFITRKPTREFEGNLTLNYESFDGKRVQGFVSGPFSDSLRGRLSFFSDQGGAWQKNASNGRHLGDKDLQSLRGQLEWDLSDALQISLQGHYARDRSEVTGLYNFHQSDMGPRDTGWYFDPIFTREAGFSLSRKPSKDNSSRGLSVKADWDLGSVRLTSITSQDYFDRDELNNYSAQSVGGQSSTLWTADDRIFSQELRLASNEEGRFNWLLGGYYSDTRIDTEWFVDYIRFYGTSIATSFTQSTRSAALFGQGDYRLRDDLKLVVGLRYEHEDIQLDHFTTQMVATPWHPIYDQSRELEKDHWSSKLALEYDFNDRVMGYASFSRGVKSGGFGGKVATVASQLDPVQPETLYAYEVGFKSDLSPRLRLNGALFYYDYRDQQVAGYFRDPSGTLISKLENAKESTIYGGELELQWRPLSGLSLGQWLGYKKGRFDDYQTLDSSGVIVDLSGRTQPFPKLSYGGSASYRWSVLDFDLEAQADYSYHDREGARLIGGGLPGADYALDAYWLANARVSLSPRDAAWSLTLYARNLFDSEYDTSRAFWATNPPETLAAAGTPRIVGVQLGIPF